MSIEFRYRLKNGAFTPWKEPGNGPRRLPDGAEVIEFRGVWHFDREKALKLGEESRRCAGCRPTLMAFSR